MILEVLKIVLRRGKRTQRYRRIKRSEVD